VAGLQTGKVGQALWPAKILLIFLFLAVVLHGAQADLSGVKPGPVTVESTADSLTVRWKDDAGLPWTAEFSLDPKRPLITAIAHNGAAVISRARPIYQCTTGKRRGGWDQFFDLPPSHPEGTRSYTGVFTLKSARATTIGDRIDVSFDGLRMGVFTGTLHYRFFPGSRLVEQFAAMTTTEPDTAYFYDAGLSMAVDADKRPGGNMETRVSYYDTAGELQSILSEGPERRPAAVRYRTIAARTGSGSVAVFPAPHQYFFPRDFTTNMSYLWHSSWKGQVALGIRQLPDDATSYYPWSNAPPGTEQQMSLFLQLDPGDPAAALAAVLRYTHSDRFPKLDGYITFAPHWHFAYTVQAMEQGSGWVPPFKPVLEAMGVDAAMINDFHGDGHPADTGQVRLAELEAYYRACRAQSGSPFLLIPAEEANVHFGGHWSLAFPKPVYWRMIRKAGQPFRETDPTYGTVYNVGDASDLLDLVRAENAFVYTTHPRTKGSMGFPDQVRDSAFFRDPHWFGAGWKALPSDLSSPRLGDRAFKLLDDMNNWGLPKKLMGEVDVFQIDTTHELYAHMNVNYVKLDSLPPFEEYGKVLDALQRGNFFTTTGEVLLTESKIDAEANGRIAVEARVRHTFPLEMAEIVWGDGKQTGRKIIPLTETHPFGDFTFWGNADAANWTWARLAVWDIAGNGAFLNPVWRDRH
jgi:hypothetical protein